MRGWRRTRAGTGMALASRLSTWLWDERGPALWVRREHAIDATAAAATALGSQGDRAAPAAPNRSTLDEKLNVARRHPPGRSGHQLPPGGPAQPGAIRSGRTHRPRGRPLPPRSSDRRRAGCAPGRAGTPTSWGRSGAAPGRGPSCATRSRSWWPRRRSRVSAAHPGSARSPSEGSPAPAARSGRACRPQAADGRACDGDVADLPQAVPGASGGASVG